jgi:hypothetical protein
MAPRSAAGPLARGRHSRLPVGATVESSETDWKVGRTGGLEGPPHIAWGAESQVLNVRIVAP